MLLQKTMSEKMEQSLNMQKHTDDKKNYESKGYLWYELKVNESVNKSKAPKLSTNMSKPKLTAEEIDDKLKKAEQRRTVRTVLLVYF